MMHHGKARGETIRLQPLDERIKEAATVLRRAERPVRILRSIAWSPQVAERFFARGARELPRVRYTPRDPSFTREGVRHAS